MIEELFGGELDDLSDVSHDDSGSDYEEPVPSPTKSTPTRSLHSTSSRNVPTHSAIAATTLRPQRRNCHRRPKKPLPTHSLVPSRVVSTTLQNLLSTSTPLTASSLSRPDPTPSSQSRKRKRRVNEGEQKRRKQKKREARKTQRAAESRPRGMQDIWLKHLMSAQPVILPHFDITSLSVAQSGFRGSQRPTQSSIFTLAELQELNFEVFRSSGDKTYVFLDKNRRFFTLHCKCDATEEGLRQQEHMTLALQTAAEAATLTPERRGSFGVLRDGHIHSGGTWVGHVILYIIS